MSTEGWLKGNRYDLDTYPYGVGYDSKGEKFYFSKEDFWLIRGYTWNVNTSSGYVLNGKTGIRMHRLIMNAKQGEEVDHINLNKADNRRNNLRFVTHQENNFNKSCYENSTTKIKGVYWSKRLQKWYAKINYNYKSIHLGVFDSIENAISARKVAEERYFKEFNYKECT